MHPGDSAAWKSHGIDEPHDDWIGARAENYGRSARSVLRCHRNGGRGSENDSHPISLKRPSGLFDRVEITRRIANSQGEVIALLQTLLLQASLQPLDHRVPG